MGGDSTSIGTMTDMCDGRDGAGLAHNPEVAVRHSGMRSHMSALNIECSRPLGRPMRDRQSHEPSSLFLGVGNLLTAGVAEPAPCLVWIHAFQHQDGGGQQ